MALCLVHGADQYPDGRINDETKARCNKAIKLYRAGRIEQVFIICCSERGGRSLAQGMLEYFVSRGVRRQHIIVDSRGMNTAGEIDVFLSFVGDKAQLVDVSSWYHVPRIFLIYLLRGRMVRHYASFAHTRLHDVIREVPAACKNLLRPRKSSKVLPRGEA